MQRGETGWILGVRTVTLVGRWGDEKMSGRGCNFIGVESRFTFLFLCCFRGNEGGG